VVYSLMQTFLILVTPLLLVIQIHHVMATPVNFSSILEAHSIRTSTVYRMTVQAIEMERLNLEACEQTFDAIGYKQSLTLIFEYQRVLAILRGDTLDRISRKIEPFD
jgi:hypothetical protein